MEYPRLKDTALVRILDSGVWLAEYIDDFHSVFPPRYGYLLALCNGGNSVELMADCLRRTYDMTVDDAWQYTFQALSAMLPALDITNEPCPGPTRYSMESFIYRTKGLPKTGQFSIPTSAMLQPTNRCNFHCTYCFAGSGPREPLGLPTEVWLGAARELLEMSVPKIEISGGEPLTHPGTAALLELLASGDAFTFLFTNGSLIDDAWAERLAAMPRLFVQISLDTTDAAHFDAMTDTHGQLAHVTHAIERLSTLGKRPNVKAVMTPTNCGDVRALAKRCAELGASALTLDAYDYCPEGRGTPEMILNADAMARVQADVDALQSEVDIPVRMVAPVPRVQWASETEHTRCAALTQSISIFSDGSVPLCERLYGRDAWLVGRYPMQSIAEIWHSPRIEELRFPLREKFTGACAHCANVATCRSGCPAAKRLVQADMYGPDPHCPRACYANNPFVRRQKEE